jgi:hypothetical protein
MKELNPQQQNLVRTVRFVHRFLLLMVPLYAFVAERIPRESRPVQPPDPTFVLAIAAAAVAQGLIAAFIRQKRVLPAQALLQNEPGNDAALKQWVAGNVMVFALSECVALFGFVLRFLGLPFAQCLLFYATAIFLFLLWRPRWGPVGMN